MVVITVDDIIWLTFLGLAIVMLAGLSIYGAIGKAYEKMVEHHQKRMERRKKKKEGKK